MFGECVFEGFNVGVAADVYVFFEFFLCFEFVDVADVYDGEGGLDGSFFEEYAYVGGAGYDGALCVLLVVGE